MTPGQYALVESIYDQRQETRHTFTNDALGQATGQQFIMLHGLDPLLHERLESKWSVSWTNSWLVAGGSDHMYHVLFQWYTFRLLSLTLFIQSLSKHVWV